MDILLVALASFFILRRWKLEWAIVFIMALATNIFQFKKVFTDFLYIPNMSDGALFLILLMFICFKHTKYETVPYKGIQKAVIIFLAYLLFIIVIDLTINGTSIISVLKTSRHWLSLLILFVIPKIPYNVLNKVLRITLYITLVASIIVVLEFVLGTEYFTTTLEENGIKRGPLPTYYALFYTLLLFTGYYEFSKIKKCIFLAILIVSQLVSTTRSISLAIILGIAICIWYLSNNKLNSFIKLGVLCIAIYLASFAMPSLNKRFNEAFEEASRMEQSSKNLDDEGNMTFRLYMLAERYQYLKTDPLYYLFGIGNVIEQDFPTTFRIGGYSEEMQRPTQLDTGDISWPLIILRLGMIGLILYLIIALQFIITKSKIKKDRLCITLKAYLWASLLVISFAGYQLARGEFWIMPIICMTMVNQINIYHNNKQLINDLNKQE